MTQSIAPMQLRTGNPAEEGSSTSASAASVALAAGVAYSVLFAEAAFLDYLRERGQGQHLGLVLGVLALSAAAGSVAAAWAYREQRAQRHVAAGFLGCLLGAFHAIAATTWPLPVSGALLVGVSAGWTTVTLAMCLRPSIRHRRLGRWIGLGVGVAYAFCSQPAVYQASTERKVFLAAGAAVVGIAMAFLLRSTPLRRSSAPDYAVSQTRYWLFFFLALALLDTIAGCVIPNVPHLKLRLWEGGLPLQGNALIHLAIAVLAGFALDHHRTGATATTALIFLALGALLLTRGAGQPVVAQFAHVAGVSTAATLLLHLAARSGRVWFAAALTSVVWLATSLGLGLAHAWLTVPMAVGVSVVTAAAAVLYLRQRALNLGVVG